MSPTILSLLSLKYGIMLGKVVYALKSGNYEKAADAFLKTAEAQAIKKGEALAPKTTLNSLLHSIAKQLEDNPDWRGSKEEQEEAIAEAGETLGAGFSFDTLAQNLKTPERLPNIWLRKRLPNPPATMTASQIRQEALLKATAEALVEIPLNELPGFYNWYVDFEVKHLEELSDNVREMLGKEGVADVEFERTYRKALVRNHNKVELFIERGRHGDEDFEQTLTVAYVTLSLSQGRGEQQQQTFFPADSLLDKRDEQNPNVFVLGTAGSGKTTLLRWLAIQAAAPEYRRRIVLFPPNIVVENEWREKVPLLVRLRLWEMDGLPTPEQFLTKGEKYDGMQDGWALRILKAGRGLVLLDGLDELTPQIRKNALTWIENLTKDYPNGNVFVASSRPQAVEPGVLKDAGFQEYAVQELSTLGRKEFVNKWHEAVADRIGTPLAECMDLIAMQQRILDAMKTNVSVRTLASNPLLCALMCALNRFYKEELPRDLHELCESACQMLLWDRDFRQGLATKGACPPGYERLSKADRRHVAQRLAYTMIKESGATLPRTSALATIQQALSLKPDEDARLVEDVLEGLIQRSSLVRPCDEDDVEFAHNILRDYLASSLFVAGDEWRYLLKKLDEEGPQRWEPIILFAVADASHKDFVVGLMEGLLKPSRLNKTRRLRRELVTLKAEGRVQFRLSRDMQEQIDALRRDMKVDTSEKAIALAEAGETAVDFLLRRPGMSETEEAACVHGLGRIEGELAKERLAEYLREDAPPTVLEALVQFYSPEEMAAVVNVLRIPSLVESIQSFNSIPEEYLPYIRDLTPLQSLVQLQELSLNNTSVSDLTPLQSLVQLQHLSLQNTLVSDLAPLQNLVQLQTLYLHKTSVTQEEVERFAEARKKQGLRVVEIYLSDPFELAMAEEDFLFDAEDVPVVD